MIKIVTATHKKYRMPQDDMYLPLYVGAGKKTEEPDDKSGAPAIGFERDDTGDNISYLNPGFCELTGLYWAWKNLDADYIGLVHYRRHFSMKRKGRDPFGNILTNEEIEQFLGVVRVFVPKKRRYYIETLYSHYAHTHYAEHLDIAADIVKEKYPDYLESLKKVYAARSGYMFNMMIMERRLFNDYCAWLFDILFELLGRVNTEGLSGFQARFYGRVSEILFNAWLDLKVKEGALRPGEIMELPYIYTEKVKWGRKAAAFLGAKFLKKKYEGSF